MFREIVKAAPLSAALIYGLWHNAGIPLIWATVVGIHAASTIWLVQLVKKEASPH